MISTERVSSVHHKKAQEVKAYPEYAWDILLQPEQENEYESPGFSEKEDGQP